MLYVYVRKAAMLPRHVKYLEETICVAFHRGGFVTPDRVTQSVPRLESRPHQGCVHCKPRRTLVSSPARDIPKRFSFRVLI